METARQRLVAIEKKIARLEDSFEKLSDTSWKTYDIILRCQTRSKLAFLDMPIATHYHVVELSLEDVPLLPFDMILASIKAEITECRQIQYAILDELRRAK